MAVEPERWAVVEPIRGATVLREEVQGPTADNTVPARSRASRVRYLRLWIRPVPVLAPLRDVSMHVVQAPSIRPETSYRHHLVADLLASGRVRVVSVVVRLIRADGRAGIDEKEKTS